MFDPILYWNEAVLEANARDHTTPPAPGLPKRVDTRGPTGSSWAFALVHLAMYDAVVAVSGTRRRTPGSHTPARRPVRLGTRLSQLPRSA